MKEIQLFDNPEFGEIRTKEVNGEPWFSATDVARALGYTNPRDAIARHCKPTGVVNHDVGVQTGEKADGTPSVQTVQMKFINEGNVYRLISRSTLQSAEKFESWLFEEVAPAIRKHGVYLTQQKLEEVLANPDTIIQLATQLKEERRKSQLLESCNQENLRQLTLQAPKVEYYEKVLDSEGLISTTIIAKDLGMSANTLNKKLHKLSVIYRVQGAWVPYSKYQDTGYCKSKTFPVVDKDGKQKTVIHFYWTEKGRQFINNLLQNSKRA